MDRRAGALPVRTLVRATAGMQPRGSQWLAAAFPARAFALSVIQVWRFTVGNKALLEVAPGRGLDLEHDPRESRPGRVNPYLSVRWSRSARRGVGYRPADTGQLPFKLDYSAGAEQRASGQPAQEGRGRSPASTLHPSRRWPVQLAAAGPAAVVRVLPG